MQDFCNTIRGTTQWDMGLEEGEVQAKGIENMFNKMIGNYFPNLEKETAIQV
jgi:hypothetical protein